MVKLKKKGLEKRVNEDETLKVTGVSIKKDNEGNYYVG